MSNYFNLYTIETFHTKLTFVKAGFFGIQLFDQDRAYPILMKLVQSSSLS